MISPEITGYVFPNDVHIHWTLMIVMYPYITGLVAGSFIISSLYHLFGRNELRPVGRFSIVASFAFLFFAAFPLWNHLGHPERAWNILFTPNFTSAMAGFGIIYATYFIIVLLENWLLFRKEIILYARQSRGFKRFFYAVIALGVYDISEESIRFDKKIIVVLSAIGIPAACLLHGYVGFLFGALKSNPWWSTPLMPVIFLFSAMVSGIAMMIIIYQIAMKFKRIQIDQACIQTLCRWLWLFMILTVTLELLEIITLAYEGSKEWEIIEPLIKTKLSFSFISIQMVLGSLIPFILLMIVVLMNRYLHEKVRNTLAIVSSLLLLIQVFAMRWNVVIGGQLFSKSLTGMRENYFPDFFEKEGILASIIIFISPFIFLIIFDKILPIFKSLHDKSD